MSGKSYPNDVLEQAQAVSSVLSQISPTLAFGTLNAAALTADVTTAVALQAQITSLDAQLTDLRNKREALNVGMWDKLKRFRSGVKAIYGDDSSQYEMIGGKRMSERKSPTRRATAAPSV